jgi:glutamyl-tRNA synthetase
MTVTRFAPSPTGYLHIGGARTALFNWLYARHHGGKFLLRVEDTDSERNNEEASAAILKGLTWLGLDWDGEVVYQSDNRDRHVEVAHQLIRKGQAYCCYMTQAEIDKDRAESRASGKPLRSPYRNGPVHEEQKDFRLRDFRLRDFVVRFRAPDIGAVTIEDAVQGKVTVQSNTIEDFVLLRSDGSPTFLLSGMVDDFDMGVTDVIRGDDHLTNAFKQVLLSGALGWDAPRFAHIPLIHNAEGKKLSKRDGAASVGDYEQDYLPDALFNYLLRLGWGHGNDEIIQRSEAVEWFDVDGIGRNPARIDDKKLQSLNSHYMCNKPEALAAHLGIENPVAVGLLPEIAKRAKKLSEVRAMTAFVDTPPVEKVDDPRCAEIATQLNDTDWSADALQSALRNYADLKGVKLGEVAGLVRVALTGMTQHIGVFDLLVALGREESISRLSN